MPGVYQHSCADITSHVDVRIERKEIEVCDLQVQRESARDRHFAPDRISSAWLQVFGTIGGHGLGTPADPNDGMVKSQQGILSRSIRF